MTYKELKDNIRDLGFEEDSSIEEYNEIVRNACNRGIDIIYHTVLSRMESYFKFIDPEWTMPEPMHIWTDTTDDTEINIPDKLIMLLPLLTAHYVWLDDDERKAMYYWNEYDDLKSQILAECTGGTKARIVGGVRFG